MNERSTEILKRFSQSWAETEKFFRDLVEKHGWERLTQLFGFIEKLRQQGYEKSFRLGASVNRLIISRSVEHGLRDDQKYIVIDILEPRNIEIILRDGIKIYREYQIESLDDSRLEKLIKTLGSELIT